MTPLLQPAARLRPIRRLPFPALAAIVCLAFAAAGLAALDDYGVGIDEPLQRHMAIVSADYIMGDRDAYEILKRSDRFYGPVFELPLLLVEQALGLQDSRDIYLMRHLLIHLFYIMGGFFCGLLVYRIFGSRWVALLAMLLFLLHPRLYAHSFFNSKDIPFAVMFMIALYLTHRAFRRNTIGAFALLGIVVGMAVNLRPFALLLPAAVLAMRGLDWQFVANPLRRKRILAIGGIFAASVLLTIYISHPYYWENPLRFFDGLRTLSQHPYQVINLFMGETTPSDAVPPEYIPVWFGITTPPVALLLGCVGALAVCWQGLRSPGLILRSGELRFLFLALGCLVLPVAVTIALEANTYHGWRHLYFLWGPFCLLAAAGLRWRAGSNRGELPTARLLRWIRSTLFRRKSRPSGSASGGGNLRQIVVYGVAVAGLANMVYAIVSLHPYQQVYFNLLVNRAGADELGKRYTMDLAGAAYRKGMEYLLEQYPDETLYFFWMESHREILPAEERERIESPDAWTTDFYVGGNMSRVQRGVPDGPAVYEVRIYGSAYVTISAPRMVWGAGLRPGEDVYRAAYQSATGGRSPAAQSDFDVYVRDGILYYVKDDCRPDDTKARFFLHVFPVEDDSLPLHRREYGFDNRSFSFNWRGGFFDGKCITQEPLPDYAIKRIHTGQRGLPGAEQALWKVGINLNAQARLHGMEAVSSGFFELYQDGNKLVYYRDSCVAADTQAQFFLHIFPANINDLPEERREYGFNNHGFNFSEYVTHQTGKCLAEVPLPNYKTTRIRTGQYIPGKGQLWQVEFPAGR